LQSLFTVKLDSCLIIIAVSNLRPEGPFPTSGREDELQTASLNALRNLLPPSRFRFRDERVDDMGVDGSIELLIDGKNLNMRSQVQLKGTDSTNFNQDGSLSLQVSTSNLNYLLQGPSPLYVVHINPTDELRFVWARDEAIRIESSNSSWRDQDKVSIRITSPLDVAGLDGIAARIFAETRLMRETITAVLTAASIDRVTLTIDPSTLSVRNSAEVLSALEAQGIEWVSQGRAVEALNIYQQAATLTNDRSKAQVVAAYALVMLGRYSEAIGHIAKFQLLGRPADREDEELATYLAAVCDFNLGRIGTAEFSMRLRKLAESVDTEFSLMLNLDACRRESYANGLVDTDALRAAIAAIEASSIAGPPLKFQATLVSMTLDGLGVAGSVNEGMSILKSRVRMGVVFDPSPDISAMNQVAREWENRMAILLADPLSKVSPTSRADAICLRLQVRFMTLLAIQTFSDQPPAAIPQEVEIDVAEALDVYRSTENVEGEIRVHMLHANFMELAGMMDEAKGVAASALTKAQAIGYGQMADAAQELLDGASAVGGLLAARAYMASVDEDIRIASHVEGEFVSSIAKHAQKTLNLPDDRLPQLEQDAKQMFADAKLRVEWCRHIQVVQDLTHTRSVATAYSTPLKFRCRCVPRRLESSKDFLDLSACIAQFKSRACGGCPLRSAKVPENGSS
jgi:hypothetical protein